MPDIERLEVIDLGLIPFDEALRLQMERVEAVTTGQAPPALYLLEHPPVVTLGRSGNTANLHVPPGELERRGIGLFHIKRGGDVTCHYPGQLVAYPVLRLAGRPGGLRRLFHDLESAAIALLNRWGIASARQEGRPGVFTDKGKIASIGLGMRRWVTFHGLSLNVARDVSLFSLLTPCGLPDVRPAAMELELLDAGASSWQVSMPEVKDAFVQEFKAAVAGR